eukprot:3173172-Rhodomonas_salina.1
MANLKRRALVPWQRKRITLSSQQHGKQKPQPAASSHPEPKDDPSGQAAGSESRAGCRHFLRRSQIRHPLTAAKQLSPLCCPTGYK